MPRSTTKVKVKDFTVGILTLMKEILVFITLMTHSNDYGLISNH